MLEETPTAPSSPRPVAHRPCPAARGGPVPQPGLPSLAHSLLVVFALAVADRLLPRRRSRTAPGLLSRPDRARSGRSSRAAATRPRLAVPDAGPVAVRPTARPRRDRRRDRGLDRPRRLGRWPDPPRSVRHAEALAASARPRSRHRRPSPPPEPTAPKPRPTAHRPPPRPPTTCLEQARGGAAPRNRRTAEAA